MKFPNNIKELRNRVSPITLASKPRFLSETRFLRTHATRKKPGFSDNFGIKTEIGVRNPVSQPQD
ncbi:MAG: hypothetical protein ACRCT1_08605 [Microcoleaceae cyanobacterium]